MSSHDYLQAPYQPSNGNKLFLQTLFGEDWWRVHVAAFPGDPTVQDGRWAGGLARDVLANPDHVEMNCYYVPSLLTPPGSPRRVRHFERMHVIVLDDVGPKVSLRKAVPYLGMTLPTYAIETSENNVQAGWAMNPLADFAKVKHLLTQLHKALGAGDNLTNPVSYFRLPVGRNWKSTAEGWVVRPWEPLHRMRIEKKWFNAGTVGSA